MFFVHFVGIIKYSSFTFPIAPNIVSAASGFSVLISANSPFTFSLELTCSNGHSDTCFLYSRIAAYSFISASSIRHSGRMICSGIFSICNFGGIVAKAP